jgi:hypothetical protein
VLLIGARGRYDDSRGRAGPTPGYRTYFTTAADLTGGCHMSG